MRNSHKKAFLSTAQKFSCWIGLREPNPLSDKWIGKPGGRPKSVYCKAKTADNEMHPFTGLVVDPYLCRDAFKKDTLKRAEDKWKDFLDGTQLPIGFTRIESGYLKGLVKHHGLAIYADYDIMTIKRADKNGNMTSTQGPEKDIKELNTLFEKVSKEINKKLGVPMIQHGSEFQYEGLGAPEFEYILWFGPNGRFFTGVSSMPEESH